MLPVTAAHFAAPLSNTHQSSVLHPLHVARRAQSVSHPARFLQHLHHHRCSPAFGRSVAMHPSPAQCQGHPSTTWCQTGARQLRAGITHPVPLNAGQKVCLCPPAAPYIPPPWVWPSASQGLADMPVTCAKCLVVIPQGAHAGGGWHGHQQQHNLTHGL